MNMNAYLVGSLVLAGDDGDDNVTIPSVGQTYTDSVTVRAVQTALKSKGFDPGTIDGKYGPHTEAAIKKMQLSASMPQTGVIDYGVLMALGVSIPAPYIPSASASSSYAPSSGGYASVVPAASAPGVTLSKANPAHPAASDSIPGWKIGVIAGAGALLIGGITVLAVRR